MKTPVQKLIDELKSGEFSVYNSHHVRKMMKIEKKAIVDAYWAGLNGSINDYSECQTFGDKKTKIGKGGDRYYKETFKSKNDE